MGMNGMKLLKGQSSRKERKKKEQPGTFGISNFRRGTVRDETALTQLQRAPLPPSTNMSRVRSLPPTRQFC